ncbi:MAG: extracellular solute-binding protein [Oscillospiraceae bacterium]
MRKRIIGLLLVCGMLLGVTACSGAENNPEPQASIKERLLSGVESLERSDRLYFENGLTITGMGVNFSGDVTNKNDNFFWQAIEKKTGVDLDIFWEEKDNYITGISTMLLSGIDDMPDILNASDFGIMDLADDGAVIALDDYLDLMPNIVAAVGEDRMSYWRQVDGHIYTIPSVINVPGAQTMMIRKDWLDKLGLSEPQTWDEWVNLWRAIRDNDLNGNGDTTDEIPFAAQYGADGERCFIPLLNAFGIKTSGDTQFCLLDDGTYTMVYEHPKYPEFLEAVRGLYAEGLIYGGYDTMFAAEMDAAMDENRVGTVFNWAERCRTSSQALREAGVEGALWEAVEPIAGPDGAQMTPERLMVMPMWCITSAAAQRGKTEDIIRFFDWYYSEEGSYLYSYGLEGISYDIINGEPVMSPELTANGFTDYRAAGCNISSLAGLLQEGAFMQCLFEGRSVDEMDDLTEEFYKGINVVNNGYFYPLPKTYETAAYTQYRSALITEGVCRLRNSAIKGEITVEEFFAEYDALKQRGLQKVIDEAGAAAGM